MDNDVYRLLCASTFQKMRNPKIRNEMRSILWKLSEEDSKFLKQPDHTPPEPFFVARSELAVIGMSLSILLWLLKELDSLEDKETFF